MTHICLPFTISQMIRYKTATVRVQHYNITAKGYRATSATLINALFGLGLSVLCES